MSIRSLLIATALGGVVSVVHAATPASLAQFSATLDAQWN